jgi:mannose/fructose/N-acetylgalactosamine-specific phosphotransferase system component IIB
MSILLYRVDERLIHGQVVIGWGNQLHPTRYLVVDDLLVESDWEQELYLLGLPGGEEVTFVSVDEARERLGEWMEDPVRSILLTRDVNTMLRLAEGGRLVGQTVNLGGIHHIPGREQVLPYLYIDEPLRKSLRSLEEHGVAVSARDLPGSPGVPLKTLLRFA